MTAQAEERVAVLGAGSFGRALARRLAAQGNRVTLWAPEEWAATEPEAVPEGVSVAGDLGEVSRCATLLLCVPGHVARQVAAQLGDHVRGDQVLVHTCRGLEAESGATVTALVQEESCLRKVGVLGGVLRASALDHGRTVAAVVASRFDEVTRRTRELLESPTFRLRASRDVHGVELAGAYRSICAVWVGIIDGLERGHATRALVMTEGLSEAAELASAGGGDPLTFTGYAGVGDLMATAADPELAEHEAGVKLAQGAAPAEWEAQAAEAVAAARGAAALAGHRGREVPVARALCRIVDEKAAPEAMLQALLDGPGAR